MELAEKEQWFSQMQLFPVEIFQYDHVITRFFDYEIKLIKQ